MFKKIKESNQFLKVICSVRNEEYRKRYWKCYRSYLMQCMILRKDEFVVKYGSEYYDSFKLRAKHWKEYICDKIYVIFWKRIPFEKIRPNKAKVYIKYGISKPPIHLKKHIHVNECALEYFLDQVGFEIKDEEIKSLSTTYYIKRKNK